MPWARIPVVRLVRPCKLTITVSPSRQEFEPRHSSTTIAKVGFNKWRLDSLPGPSLEVCRIVIGEVLDFCISGLLHGPTGVVVPDGHFCTNGSWVVVCDTCLEEGCIQVSCWRSLLRRRLTSLARPAVPLAKSLLSWLTGNPRGVPRVLC